MATSAQGLTFTFSGSGITVTSVQVNDTQDLLDATHLGVAPAGNRIFVAGFATDREVQIDYISATILKAGSSGTLSITGPLSFSGNATVANASVGGSVGDFVRGSATFKLTSS
jgi:hypothetical protein